MAPVRIETMSPAKCGVLFPALGVDSSARRGAWVSPRPRLLPETPDDDAVAQASRTSAWSLANANSFSAY